MVQVFGVTLVAQPGCVPEAFRFLEQLIGPHRPDNVALFVIEGNAFENESRFTDDLDLVLPQSVLHLRVGVNEFKKLTEELSHTNGVTMKELDDGSVLLRHRAFQNFFRLSW